MSFSVAKKNILKDISFKIYKNKTIILIGYSGAGKTTLVDLIIGILKPSSGKIIIDNKQVDYAKKNYLINTGYLNQINKVLNQDLENIKRDKNFESATKKAGIDFNDIKYLKNLISDLTLSGGEKQGLLSKLFRRIKNSKFMMSHLTCWIKKIKKFLLYKRKEKNKTIIIITHERILKYTDYILG